jgi:hypothetical protein
MRTLFLTTAAVAALIVIAPIGAHARVICNIDSARGHSTYTFDANTAATMVETGYRRNNVNVASDVGHRPIWIKTTNASGGVRPLFARQPRMGFGSGRRMASLHTRTRLVATQ